MQLKHRVRNAGRLFAIAACLVATYLIFGVTAMRVALKVREMPAPDLRNRTVAEATAMLQEEGLALTVDESVRIDPKVPAGRIAQQDPEPGAITRRQRTIRVWVSQGPRITIIPALIGESERAELGRPVGAQVYRAEALVARQELRHDRLVFLRLARTRGIHKPSARAHSLGGVTNHR